MNSITNKQEILRALLEGGHELEIYELLRCATNTGELDDSSAVFQDSKLVRLLGSVRNHLIFLDKFGSDIAHVEDEHGCHYFAYPEKLEEWLLLDAPGLTYSDIKNLYTRTIGNN